MKGKVWNESMQNVPEMKFAKYSPQIRDK